MKSMNVPRLLSISDRNWFIFLETNKKTSNSAHKASDKNTVKSWMFAALNRT